MISKNALKETEMLIPQMGAQDRVTKFHKWGPVGNGIPVEKVEDNPANPTRQV